MNRVPLRRVCFAVLAALSVPVSALAQKHE
jgi:hypothetical protein